MRGRACSRLPPCTRLRRVAESLVPGSRVLRRERTDERAGDARVGDELLPHALEALGVRPALAATARDQHHRAGAERRRCDDDAIRATSDALGVRRVAVRSDVFVNVLWGRAEEWG